MSLDVYLYGESRNEECDCPTCGNGHMRTVTVCLYSANITHNLGRMASEAGIYEALWRPGEMLDPELSARMRVEADANRWGAVRELEKLLPVVRAAHLIDPLRSGLELLRSDRQRFEKFNAPNGWGLYQHFVPFVEKYLAACQEHQEAFVEVSR